MLQKVDYKLTATPDFLICRWKNG